MIAFAFALAALFATPGADAPAGADAILGFADDLLVHGDPNRAIDEYTRYLFVCGSCARAPYAELRLAESYRRAGSPGVAAAREAAIAEKWPDTPEGREAARAVGEDWERAGDPAAASDAYRGWAAAHADEADAAEQARLAVRTALRAHDPKRVELAVPLIPAGTGTPLEGLIADVNRTRPRHRSPAIAGALAAVLPGAGHLYTGEWGNAFAAFSTNALFLGGAVLAAQKKEWAVAGVAGAAEVFWYGGNVIGAINSADRFDARAEDAKWRGLERRWMATPTARLSFEF